LRLIKQCQCWNLPISMQLQIKGGDIPSLCKKFYILYPCTFEAIVHYIDLSKQPCIATSIHIFRRCCAIITLSPSGKFKNLNKHHSFPHGWYYCINIAWSGLTIIWFLTTPSSNHTIQASGLYLTILLLLLILSPILPKLNWLVFHHFLEMEDWVSLCALFIKWWY